MSAARVLLYLATAAGLGLLARTLIRGPVPLWIALGAFGLYVCIAAAGVFKPQLRMYADLIWRGPTDRGEVVLTFDDGPQPEHTRRILSILDRAKVKATFFVIGAKVEKHPEVAAEIVRKGHMIGIHGYEHDRLLALRSATTIMKDLELAQRAVVDATGEVPMVFRPPVGVTSPRIDEAVRKMGLVMVAWSVKGIDGVAGARPDQVAGRVATRVRPGSIILLHDALERSEQEPASVAALPKILDAISAKGLRVVELKAWLPELNSERKAETSSS
ncbi:MAG: polysaccharide deacetylase family protein [Deltaproteobacteria bacterium]|nr:polysaccharide deacetylase family protein [Deltaproteobacteria bacterium]